ncbi:MAG: peptidylprolyl isomerase [candidate division KSB1 bacterium]|nr:peptidylprolyl isomerase [candidate division KSB1 bacterium]
MKRWWLVVLVGLGVVTGLTWFWGLSVAQSPLRVVYVAVETENLRDTPRGRILGKINKGTELQVLEERDNWLKVQITGWIWKESTSPVRPRDLAGAMRAYHIMVKTRAEAEEILRQLREGADFEQLARQKSIGPTAAQGGDLGYFFPGDFAPQFDEAIRKLKPGEISEIVETADGYHIFKRVK